MIRKQAILTLLSIGLVVVACVSKKNITKSEATALGWNPRAGNLAEVAPGKSIGGDIFGNRQSLLPDSPGRIWFEADINYTSGLRQSDRLLSNDGLIFKTTDHYQTFEAIRF